MKGVEHCIDTGDARPIRSIPYRLCPAWREQVRAELRELSEGGVTETSTSPWSSPIVPIKKPDGSLRLQETEFCYTGRPILYAYH